eukprot:3233921-Pyramimonas_sp.AAC.1
MNEAGIALDLMDCVDQSSQVFSQGLTIGGDTMTDATFVDGSGFCSPCFGPASVRDQVATLGRLVRKHMVGSGFKLHVGKRKTAAVLSYYGEGAIKAKRDMAMTAAVALD